MRLWRVERESKGRSGVWKYIAKKRCARVAYFLRSTIVIIIIFSLSFFSYLITEPKVVLYKKKYPSIKVRSISLFENSNKLLFSSLIQTHNTVSCCYECLSSIVVISDPRLDATRFSIDRSLKTASKNSHYSPVDCFSHSQNYCSNKKLKL